MSSSVAGLGLLGSAGGAAAFLAAQAMGMFSLRRLMPSARLSAAINPPASVLAARLVVLFAAAVLAGFTALLCGNALARFAPVAADAEEVSKDAVHFTAILLWIVALGVWHDHRRSHARVGRDKRKRDAEGYESDAGSVPAATVAPTSMLPAWFYLITIIGGPATVLLGGGHLLEDTGLVEDGQ